MQELKQRIESLLFSTGRLMDIEEITSLVKCKDSSLVAQALNELDEHYKNTETSLRLHQEEGKWRMTIHDKFIPYVRKVVTRTELAKGVLETLAILAYKAPMKQSELVKIRTNKAYDHLAELEKRGFIRRKKFGRTRIIALSEKFFEYFDLPEKQLRERFKKVHSMEEAIKEREKIIEEHKKQTHEARKLRKLKEDEVKEQSETEHKQLDTKIASLPHISVADGEGHVTELEVYEEKEEMRVDNQDTDQSTPSVTELHEQSNAEPEQEPRQKDILEEAREAAQKTPHEHKEGKGLYVDNVAPEIEKKITDKIEYLLHPESEKDAANKEKTEDTKESP